MTKEKTRRMDGGISTNSTQCSANSRISILLLDAHALTRSCIGSLLSRADRKNQVYTLPSIANTDGAPLPHMDLVLWNLGSMRITDAAVDGDLRLIRERLPDVPLVVFCKHNDAAHALDAVRLGARGYIPTSLSLPVMVAALRLILVGGVYVAPISTEAAAPIAAGTVSSSANPRNGQAHRRLTNREEEVLDLLKQGKPNKLIAYELHMSENTVKVHVRRIIKKLNVINRTEAARTCWSLTGRHQQFDECLLI